MPDQPPVPGVEKPAVSSTPPIPVETKRPQKTLNLKDIFQQPKKEELPEIVRRAKPVNLEDLHHAWAQFSETKKEDLLEHKVLCYPYTLANTTLTLTLENSMEESILQLFKEELLTFLRDRLENDSLSLVVQMSESNGEKIAFTNKEKFEEMAEKNPFLREMQKQFQLDPDF